MLRRHFSLSLRLCKDILSNKRRPIPPVFPLPFRKGRGRGNFIQLKTFSMHKKNVNLFFFHKYPGLSCPAQRVAHLRIPLSGAFSLCIAVPRNFGPVSLPAPSGPIRHKHEQGSWVSTQLYALLHGNTIHLNELPRNGVPCRHIRKQWRTICYPVEKFLFCLDKRTWIRYSQTCFFSEAEHSSTS